MARDILNGRFFAAARTDLLSTTFGMQPQTSEQEPTPKDTGQRICAVCRITLFETEGKPFPLYNRPEYATKDGNLK